ncbi:hypothetical protein JND45_15860 [Listeria monocytogenes]|nr:hypothetical protein [Listeria monocytogenes]
MPRSTPMKNARKRKAVADGNPLEPCSGRHRRADPDRGDVVVPGVDRALGHRHQQGI